MLAHSSHYPPRMYR
jgi:hypothetical protein